MMLDLVRGGRQTPRGGELQLRAQACGLSERRGATEHPSPSRGDPHRAKHQGQGEVGVSAEDHRPPGRAGSVFMLRGLGLQVLWGPLRGLMGRRSTGKFLLSGEKGWVGA